MIIMWRVLLILLPGLAACSPGLDDLEQFTAAVKARPPTAIAALPAFSPYESYVYNALSLRAPFERPAPQPAPVNSNHKPNAAPDTGRPPGALESYDLNALALVGSLSRNGSHWALVKAPDGRVYRVAVGDYIGRNHGRITAIQNTHISLTELVAAGLNQWRERPRIITITSTEN